MKRIIIIGIILIAGIKVSAQVYNPADAAEYAREYCNKRNPRYDDYTGRGGDCANFVSQCLIAGGLDLSAGNPNTTLPNKGLDSYGCIPNAENLVTHLIKYQKADTLYKKSGDYHLWAEPGDPAFLLNAHGDITTAWHSYICSQKDPSSGEGLFSTHTTDRCGTNTRSDNQIHFQMTKASIPDHCNNCVQDEDLGETGVDCGGSCPPCQHAKNAVNYNYNTLSLPRETRAFETITAGNADVRILPGQDVTFIAVGDVTLKPGFHAQSGSNFKVHKAKTKKDAGADCGEFCELRKNAYCRSTGEYFHLSLTNAVSYKVWILQLCKNMNTIFYDSDNIEVDGIVNFWDLRTGIETKMGCYTNHFYYEIELLTCKGDKEKLTGLFYVVDNCSKSAQDNEIMYDIYHDSVRGDRFKNNEYIIHPNPNSGSFTIKTNNFDNITQIQVFNPLGQIIYSIENPTDNNITLPSGAKGTYFVRITTETESVTRKILVE